MKLFISFLKTINCSLFLWQTVTKREDWWTHLLFHLAFYQNFLILLFGETRFRLPLPKPGKLKDKISFGVQPRYWFCLNLFIIILRYSPTSSAQQNKNVFWVFWIIPFIIFQFHNSYLKTAQLISFWMLFHQFHQKKNLKEKHCFNQTTL